jgi:DNA-binding transcriptional MerR regulator
MEWSIQEIAGRVGTTSRTLRHYDDIGLLAPSRTGSNGLRYYDPAALVRLQRILLLRELGIGLPAIAEVLAGQRDPTAALRTHLRLLESERDRLDRQIASVTTTIDKSESDEALMADEILDGFDHTAYRDEVVERWGQQAADDGTAAWEALGPEGRRAHQIEHDRIAAGIAAAHQRGDDVTTDAVQDLVARHHAWVSTFWTPSSQSYLNLGQMYVDDPRFTATYDRHGTGTASFLRDAMAAYAERSLTG